jgi:hypothetical protein
MKMQDASKGVRGLSRPVTVQHQGSTTIGPWDVASKLFNGDMLFWVGRPSTGAIGFKT